MRRRYLCQPDGSFVELDKAPPQRVTATQGDSMAPLLNHADGRVYDSKSAFRRATRAADCYEVGNDWRDPPKEFESDISPRDRREYIESLATGGECRIREEMGKLGRLKA